MTGGVGQRSRREWLQGLNYVATLRASRVSGRNLWIYGRSRVLIGRSASLRLPGRLLFGRSWQRGERGSSHLRIDGNLEVQSAVSIYTEATIQVSPEATLRLGSGSINHDSHIECYERIEIGRDVAIGPEVMIRDSDSHTVIGGGPPSAPVFHRQSRLDWG